MAVYLGGLYLNLRWTPTFQLLGQTILLTTVQGIIMVAAAVVISSQTTSVRAANLLASFIIVPMALLIQGEAAALFWGNHFGLWWLILALGDYGRCPRAHGSPPVQARRADGPGPGRDSARLDGATSFGAIFPARRCCSANSRQAVTPHPLTWFKQTVAIVPSLLAADGGAGAGGARERLWWAS
jgi:hypothetical protein